MKSPFQPIYAAAELLAGLALIAILVLVLAGVVFRLAGHQLAGSDDLSGYCLVALVFLALAPTYRRGEHIRVGLLINHLGGAARERLEAVVLAAAVVGTAWATWWLGRTAYNSWRFDNVSDGLLAVPLWIPQLPMVLGMAALVLALAEDLVRCLRSQAPSYVALAAEGTEMPTFER